MKWHLIGGDRVLIRETAVDRFVFPPTVEQTPEDLNNNMM